MAKLFSMVVAIVFGISFVGLGVVQATDALVGSSPIIVASGQAGDDHGKAGDDHGKAGDNHGKAGNDHGKAGEDHGNALPSLRCHLRSVVERIQEHTGSGWAKARPPSTLPRVLENDHRHKLGHLVGPK